MTREIEQARKTGTTAAENRSRLWNQTSETWNLALIRHHEERPDT